MSGETLSPWTQDPTFGHEHAWMRFVVGGNPYELIHRRVFIEKTPRVLEIESRQWVEGPKGEGGQYKPGSGIYGEDPKSRAWADKKAKELGYILT